MSRQISCRHSLFYLSVSVILVCGLSRRIPREASCPSCSLDCPEALTVQLPWNPQESNLRNVYTNSFQNSPSRLLREGISQNIERNNVPLNQNSIFFGNYRRFQQEPANQNLFSKNYLHNFPQSLDEREIFSQDKAEKRYPRVVPSRQMFDRSKNLVFRNPRNKYSEFLSGDYKKTKDYEKIEEDPISKLLVYRSDRDIQPSEKYSKDASSNVIQSEKSFPTVENIENIYRLRREDILDEERNVTKKISNSPSQLRYPRERYNSIGFDPSEVKRDPYVKDTDIPKSTKKFFDNWNIAKDSNLGQFRNNLLELHPTRKQEIIVENDNEINSNSYNSKFPQDLNIWNSKNNEESFDSMMRANIKPFENEEDEDMKEYFGDETDYFMDDKDMKEFYEDKDIETEQDAIKTGRDNINPYILPQNFWEETESEELDDLDFMHENSQKKGQLGLYSEENNKYFQDEQNENLIFRDKTYTSAETARAPVINAYNAYILPRYLNIVNDKKYSTKSETQESLEDVVAKNSIRANPVKESVNHRISKDENNNEGNIMRIQDFLFPKNIFNVEEYNNPIVEKRNNIKNKHEALTELDPDLLDDIENPPVEITESTLM